MAVVRPGNPKVLDSARKGGAGVDEAKRLTEKARRMIDIALAAGFSSPKAFFRAFKTTFGQAPTAFRASGIGISGIPETVAEEIESQNDNNHRHNGEHEPGIEHDDIDILRVVKKDTPACHGCSDPQSEE